MSFCVSNDTVVNNITSSTHTSDNINTTNLNAAYIGDVHILDNALIANLIGGTGTGYPTVINTVTLVPDPDFNIGFSTQLLVGNTAADDGGRSFAKPIITSSSSDTWEAIEQGPNNSAARPLILNTIIYDNVSNRSPMFKIDNLPVDKKNFRISVKMTIASAPVSTAHIGVFITSSLAYTPTTPAITYPVFSIPATTSAWTNFSNSITLPTPIDFPSLPLYIGLCYLDTTPSFDVYFADLLLDTQLYNLPD